MAADLRAADDADWRRIVGGEPPPHWIGLVSDRDPDAIGALYEATDRRWWIVVKRGRLTGHPLARRLLVGARDILSTAAAAEAPVHALADPDIPGARRLLEHVGFRATGETLIGQEVLVWAQS